MKRPDFNEKTEVKVINQKIASFYGMRGKVDHLIVVIDGKQHNPNVDKELLKTAYAEGRINNWLAAVKFPDNEHCQVFEVEDIQPVQHKFIDIDYIREEDLVIGKKEDGTDAIRPKNTGAFEPGDIISITTKIDGANASIAWDETTGKLEIFSRTNLLNAPGSLRGFYDYIKTNVEPKVDWSGYPTLVFFGEWEVPHTCKYSKDAYNHWYIYDIWNAVTRSYLCQSEVKAFCKKFKLDYIEELYYGPFMSWDHCRSFLNKSTAYGPEQEGIVIKNQTKLSNLDNRNPVYIKIVDEKFKEHMANKGHKQKEIDPEKEAEKQKAMELASSIVTEARVRKLILKLIDEGKLPETLTPKDMGSVMKQLPRLVFDDCLKEESETVKQLGEFAGKFIAAETSKWAKKIVIG